MQELLSNRILWTAVLADVIAQILKALLVLLLERRWSWERLFGSGGMPSSHSALVAALATGIALTEGPAGATFAVAAVLAVIVMYDAMGVRRAAGRQAELINDLVREFSEAVNQGFRPAALKTLLGHSYPQVAAGTILGIAAALVSFR